MKILILGGTVFLGRHLVESALSRDHQVTLFNRGRSSPDLFVCSPSGGRIPEVERLTGDRTRDLTALEGGRWEP